MNEKTLTKTLTNEELLDRVITGDGNAQNELVEKNMGLVYSVAKRFLNRGHERDDLIQIGSIGLIKAIQKFDKSFGVKFSTYAVPMIMGEIKRFIRDDGMIKVSRSLKELSSKAMAIKERITAETGSEPSMRDIASELATTPEELAAALEAGVRHESLYTISDDGSHEGRPLIERIECDKDYESGIVDKIILKEAIESFGERERKIIMLRYFKQKTQSQIAEMLGISQVQVSRIEKKVLLKMREKISGE
ncbi:MAG: SigB/SigF/SigG family RNA polymerase sigma factor [Oscillospiraceae bacterium]